MLKVRKWDLFEVLEMGSAFLIEKWWIFQLKLLLLMTSTTMSMLSKIDF